ncbi:MAG: TetR/AcrR family transcriptional regulator [Clostridia bacterium]|nr:TetR/AcrR family transcriptional regulator [Clostridia bacterium]
MAAAFTEAEKQNIRKALLSAAKKYARTVGMKKTSVEMLAEDAGISKGAFYAFFETKEHLFLAMLEDWQDDIYRIVRDSYEKQPELPLTERIGGMIETALKLSREESLPRFVREDVPALIRKLPPEIVAEHHKSDEERLYEIIELTGVRLKVPKETVIAVIRVLLKSLLFAEEIGPAYPDAIRTLVLSSCGQLIETEER